MAKIRINKSRSFASMTDAIEDAGYGLDNATGETVLTFNIPGVAPVGTNREGLALLAEVIGGQTQHGESPASVFARTSHEDSEGNLTGRFSEKKKSRSVTIPAADRPLLAEVFMGLLGQWDDFEAQLAEDVENPESPTE